MLVSFIIPAYNASATIKRCLDSLYALPIEESVYETIVIDDCSTDNTIELVKDYSKDHTNLVLLRQQENHRQGAARNRGIAVSQGKYIVFVDSDDETAKGVVDAIQLVEKNDLDMVAMRYAKVGKEGKIDGEVSLSYGQDKVFNGIEMQTEFAFWATAPWAYVYRKAFLDKVNYPFAEDVLFEDSDFVNVHLFHAKRMSYCDECGYRIHYNANSTTHTISYKHLADYVLLGTRMLALYESLPDKTTKYAEGILEGGSFNVMKSFRRLVYLNSSAEIRAFYNRLDNYYDRSRLLGYRNPTYCWTRWTRFCLKHRKLATLAVSCVLPIFRKIQ